MTHDKEKGISYGDRLTFIDADARPPTPEGDGSQLLSSIQLDDDDDDDDDHGGDDSI